MPYPGDASLASTCLGVAVLASGTSPVERWLCSECSRLHREGAPASTAGGEVWYLHGLLHRDDGPATSDGVWDTWAQHGRRHRLDGPAAIHRDGDRHWYVRGRHVATTHSDRHGAYRNTVLDDLFDAGEPADLVTLRTVLETWRPGDDLQALAEAARAASGASGAV